MQLQNSTGPQYFVSYGTLPSLFKLPVTFHFVQYVFKPMQSLLFPVKFSSSKMIVRNFILTFLQVGLVCF